MNQSIRFIVFNKKKKQFIWVQTKDSYAYTGVPETKNVLVRPSDVARIFFLGGNFGYVLFKNKFWGDKFR